MKKLTMLFVFVIISVGYTSAWANVKQLKTYREVYPDYKPQCIYCHTSDKPKKEDGEHELNAYGLKLQELMNGEALSADMIESVGSHEDFKSEEEAPMDESSMNDAIDTLDQDVSALSENMEEVSKAVEDLADAANKMANNGVQVAGSQ